MRESDKGGQIKPLDSQLEGNGSQATGQTVKSGEEDGTR